jgi:hypothetical protein
MQEAIFLLLTALAGGSQHGYLAMFDVATISDGRVRLRAGGLPGTWPGGLKLINRLGVARRAHRVLRTASGLR